jgi:hypothetical protein
MDLLKILSDKGALDRARLDEITEKLKKPGETV